VRLGRQAEYEQANEKEVFMMKKWIVTLVVIALALAGVAGAARGGQSTYSCYTTNLSNATCTITATGGVFNTTDTTYNFPNCVQGQPCVYPPGATLYDEAASFSNKPKLSQVHFSANYLCGDSTTTTCAQATNTLNGNPLQLEVFTSGGFAWITAFDCGQTGAISTDNAGCDVQWVDGFTHQLYVYANWAAFAAAHPTFTFFGQAPDVTAGQLSTTVTISNFVGSRSH
jgi:hypothetical protein